MEDSGHAALFGAQWERILALGCQVTRDFEGIYVDDGRGADVCFDRQHGGRGVEYGGSGPEKRKLAGGLLDRLRTVRGRVAASRARKWYPGAVAAVGAGVLLAKDGSPGGIGNCWRAMMWTTGSALRRRRFAETLAGGWA
jgi:hypothetical protein